MEIADHNDPQYRELASYMLSHHFLADANFAEFGFYDELLYDFNRLKKDCFHRAHLRDCKVISLGQNCLPHTLLVKWGVIPTLAQDPSRKRLPFDLAFHHAWSVAKILESSFADYYPDSIGPTWGDRKGKYFKNFTYNTLFNHEWLDEQRTVSENFAWVNARIAERVAAFKEICASKNKLFVFYFEEKAEPAYAMALTELIRRQYNAPLLIASKYPLPDDPGLRLLNYPPPYESYVWHHPRSWLTSTGFDQEYRFVNFVLEFMEKNFPETADPHPSPPLPSASLYAHVADYYCGLGKYEMAGRFLDKCGEFPEGDWRTLYDKVEQKIRDGKPRQ